MPEIINENFIAREPKVKQMSNELNIKRMSLLKEKERRYKILLVSPETIIELLNNWKTKDAVILPELNLPEGTNIINVYWSNQRQTFEIVLEHHTFDIVLDGAMLPILNDIYITIVETSTTQESFNKITDYKQAIEEYQDILNENQIPFAECSMDDCYFPIIKGYKHKRTGEMVCTEDYLYYIEEGLSKAEDWNKYTVIDAKEE